MSNGLFVSKNDQRTINELKRELEEDRNYLMKTVGNTSVRTRLLTKIFCMDCNNTECVANPLPLGSDTPIAVICKKCEFNYYPKS